ncbi:MAG: hypothetical protein GX811_08960, partial [Lentisphaerae bacterium]|nr:hypothetical protein [Lentisphaerota bacterium]
MLYTHSYAQNTCTWNGNGTDELASTPENWSDNTAPVTGDNIILNNTSSKDMTWDLNIQLMSWIQDGYEGEVTLETVYSPTGFTNLHITGNCVINTGTITHKANQKTQDYMLNMSVGGNLTVGVNGTIDAVGKGHYGAKVGPGTDPTYLHPAGSYGGRGGAVGATYGPGPCYGSIVAPTNIGTSGKSASANETGGGAIRLTVSGNATVEGTIIANSPHISVRNDPHDNVYAGSGGSVWITAGSFSGSGNIMANSSGFAGSGVRVGGGGGRISLISTDPGFDFSNFNAQIQAYGGLGYEKTGAAGTVYLECEADPHGGGSLIIDNNNYSTVNYTELCDSVNETFIGNVIIKNGGRLVSDEDHVFEVSGIWSNAGTYIALPGSQIVFSDRFVSTIKLYGNSTFFNLLCSGGPMSILFEPATTTTIDEGGSLIFHGPTSTYDLFVGSITQGEQWKLKLDGTASHTIQFVEVEDSDASPGVELLGLFAKDSGNNLNWSFNSNPPGGENVWEGNIDADWRKNDNWSFERVPMEEDSVRIPVTANDPQLMGIPQTVSTLTIEENATLFLNGLDLTLTEDLVVHGTLSTVENEIITVQNNLMLTGTLNLNGSPEFVLKGDLDLTGGLIQPGFSVFRIAGNTQQSLDFSNLSLHKLNIDNSSSVYFVSGFSAHEFLTLADSQTARHIYFDPGIELNLETLTLVSEFTTTNIFMRSSQPGSPWILNVSDWVTVCGVNVEDSDATGGLEIPAIYSNDGGNNQNWDFNPPSIFWTGHKGNGKFEDPDNWFPASVPDQNTFVVLDNAELIKISEETTVKGLTVRGSVQSTLLVVSNSLTVLQDVTIANNGTVAWNREGSVAGSLRIYAGAKLTHDRNAANEINKISIDIGGDFELHSGGTVDAVGMGHSGARVGPGAGTSNTAASHGGQGGTISGAAARGPCYGSITAPTNIGSSGRDANLISAGGGAIRLNIAGTATINGNVSANSPRISLNNQPDTNIYAGSGGSVWITAAKIIGSGNITASSGGYQGSGARCCGGGGRIAIVLKDENAVLTEFTGNIQAIGGIGYGGNGGPGTVYLKTVTPVSETVLINN